MSESVETRPSSQVLPHELPASLREAELANWIREPLDDAVDRRRRGRPRVADDDLAEQLPMSTPGPRRPRRS
jgi:hypothetical protein